jgi:glycosyltransferase involved in cell wall biosynthesis
LTAQGLAVRAIDVRQENPMLGQPAVLVVCFTTVFGGAEVRVMQTARALATRGWSYRVAVLPDTRLHAALEEEGLAAAPMGRHRADPRLVPGLVGAARALGATCLDSHNMQSQYWASLAGVLMPSVRRIVTVHSIYRECYPRPPKQQVHEGALRLARGLGSRFVAVSETVADDLIRQGVAPDRITISQNGIEPLAAPPAPSPLFADLGWGPEAFVIAIIGRLEPVKGHAHLIEAIGRLSAEGERRVRLLVVGEGRDRAALEGQAAALGLAGRVHFAGFRQDVTALLARTDLLAMPSLTEGLPYTALEAGRQGVPLLLSRVGGPARIFTGGEDAAFVPPADPEALRAAIAALIAAPEDRSRLGSAARRLVESRFSVDRMATETLAIYEG